MFFFEIRQNEQQFSVGFKKFRAEEKVSREGCPAWIWHPIVRKGGLNVRQVRPWEHSRSLGFQPIMPKILSDAG
jgi:hypothetical protein